MEIKDRILLADADKSECLLLRGILRAEGYEVLLAQTLRDTEMTAASRCPDLILLDPEFPDGDGLTLIGRVRKWSSAPILVLGNGQSQQDAVTALDLGADDYIVKPPGTEELPARVRAALRRAHTGAGGEILEETESYTTGELRIDYFRHNVTVRGRDALLTQNEYRIVAILSRYAGRVVSYEAIMREIWGPNAGTDNKILRVNMANIRRKIERDPANPEYLFTIAGVGYRMRGAE